LYGAICSFKGCTAFEDMMKNTDIKNWYNSMKDQVENSKGSSKMNSDIAQNILNKDINSNKKQKRFFFF